MAQIAEKTIARQEEADAERLYDQLNVEEGRLAELRCPPAHHEITMYYQSTGKAVIQNFAVQHADVL